MSDTYQQYLIIYFPGIIGAILALASIQLPLVGRKWSLVFSALCQGVSMAMYTQVSNTAAYVGLNALEYIMQTVSAVSKRYFIFTNRSLVFQCRPICIRSGTLRHRLPRQCEWHAFVPRSHCRNCRTLCGCSASC